MTVTHATAPSTWSPPFFQAPAGERVLVVDDDTALADLLYRAFTRKGFLVDNAATGSEALGRILENHYDAVVLDLMIPAPDGLTVLRRIRETGHGVPVLVLSARGDLDDRVRGLEAGADDYLAKPFSLLELVARVRALTRLGRRLREDHDGESGHRWW